MAAELDRQFGEINAAYLATLKTVRKIPTMRDGKATSAAEASEAKWRAKAGPQKAGRVFRCEVGGGGVGRG